MPERPDLIVAQEPVILDVQGVRLRCRNLALLDLEPLERFLHNLLGDHVGSREAQSRTGRTDVDVDEHGNVGMSASEAFTATLGPANLLPTACELWLGWIDFYRD